MCESTLPGEFLYKFIAEAGIDDYILFEIISGNEQNFFEINSINGDLKLIKNLDYENISYFILKIMAKSSIGSNSSIQFEIYVDDANDNIPFLATDFFVIKVYFL